MPSTLGIVASHNNYQPPTFSIVPDKTTIKEGEIVTYTITTTNFAGSLLFAEQIGTARSGNLAPYDLNIQFPRTIVLSNGTGTLAISALNDTAVEGPETIIVNLRTGSTAGPIVATAPTVTINDMSPAYETTFAQTNYNPRPTSWGGTTTVNFTKNDGRWQQFQIKVTALLSNGLATGQLKVNGTTNYTISTSGGTSKTETIARKIPVGAALTFDVSQASVEIKVYAQTDASFAITG